MKSKEKPVLYEYLSYRIIRFDSFNYVLEKYTLGKKISHNKKEIASEKSWKRVGYTCTFGSACKLLRNNLINEKLNYKQISRLVQMFERDVSKENSVIIDKLNKAIERQHVILTSMTKSAEKKHE